MKRNCALLFTMLVVSGIITGSSYAAVPMLLSHQGRLLDASDQPVSGTRDITFHIYGDSTGGSPLWTEEHLDVPIANGLFHVTLGGTVTISADLLANTGPGVFNPANWLVLQIEGTELLPRMRLGSAPYAVMSSRVSGDVETLPGALTVKGMSGSTTGTIRMQATGDSAIFGSVLDVDGDDVPDVGSGSEALVPRNILKSFFQTGDFPTQAQFTTQSGSSSMDLECLEIDEEHTASISADSTGAELKFKDGPILGGMSGSTTGTIRVGHGGGGGGGIGGDAFTVTGIFQDGTSEDVTEMKTARKDITINLRHTDLTGVEGDQTADVAVDSGGSELKLSSGPLSGMSGSTTATIRTGATSGGGGGGGGALQQAYIATGTYSDGTNESSVEQVSNVTGAGSRWKGMSGSTTGTIRMMATADSVDREMTFDDPLTGASMKVKEKGSRTKCSSNFRFMTPTDSSDVLMECDATSARHELSGMSGSTTGTIRMAASPDSAGAYLDHDSDGDGFSEAKITITARDQFGNPIPGMVVSADTDDDGVANNEAELACDATGSRSILSGMSGSTTGTIRMQATPDSVDNEVSFDDTLSGVSSKVKEKAYKTKCSTLLQFKRTTDSSGVEETCDSTGARSILSGMSGSTTGTIRMAASPDSAVFDLGISGSTTGTIRIQTSSSGVANPIEHSSGAHLTVGGDWTNASDKALKENFTKIDGEELLEKIEELPITQWNYKNEDESITHIGPTAQDFQKTFGVGSNDKSISTIDPSGIALAAIKELNRQNQDLSRQNKELKKQLDDLNKKVEELVSRR